MSGQDLRLVMHAKHWLAFLQVGVKVFAMSASIIL
jgi:hypothetical protein